MVTGENYVYIAVVAVSSAKWYQAARAAEKV